MDVMVSDNCLHCPGCGNSDGLHHVAVASYDREEDAAITRVTRINKSGVVISDSDGKGNPSARRDGVVIRFRCEFCPVMSELTFAQHKGFTIMKWRQKEFVAWIRQSWPRASSIS